MKDIRIYVMTHKKCDRPEDGLYHLLHVGRALGTDLGYEGDDTGDEISSWNRQFCELTGIYYIWKNISCDVVGICHYRRFFGKGNRPLDGGQIKGILDHADIILPQSIPTQQGSLWRHYDCYHYRKDMLTVKEVLREMEPQYLDAFELCMNCNLHSPANMMISSKQIFDEYCSWLFPLLFEVRRRTDLSGYDEYQARLYGFLSERLLRVWVLKHPYRVYESDAYMTV